MLLVPICVTVTLKRGLAITDIYLENTIGGGGANRDLANMSVTGISKWHGCIADNVKLGDCTAVHHQSSITPANATYIKVNNSHLSSPKGLHYRYCRNVLKAGIMRCKSVRNRKVSNLQVIECTHIESPTRHRIHPKRGSLTLLWSSVINLFIKHFSKFCKNLNCTCIVFVLFTLISKLTKYFSREIC